MRRVNLFESFLSVLNILNLKIQRKSGDQVAKNRISGRSCTDLLYHTGEPPVIGNCGVAWCCCIAVNTESEEGGREGRENGRGEGQVGKSFV